MSAKGSPGRKRNILSRPCRTGNKIKDIRLTSLYQQEVTSRTHHLKRKSMFSQDG